jgi:hypothetical protein
MRTGIRLRHCVVPVLSLAMLLSVGLSAGCSTRQGAPLKGRQSGSVSAETTVGPLALNETATVGPYQITMTRARLLKNPKAGPGMASVPPVPAGHLLVDIVIDVRTTKIATSTVNAPPTVPNIMGFRLENDRGHAFSSSGVGLSRSQSTSTDPHTSGTGEFMSTPLRPHETVSIYPQYVVPAGTTHLTLFFHPLSERPVVIFTVK